MVLIINAGAIIVLIGIHYFGQYSNLLPAPESSLTESLRNDTANGLDALAASAGIFSMTFATFLGFFYWFGKNWLKRTTIILILLILFAMFYYGAWTWLTRGETLLDQPIGSHLPGYFASVLLLLFFAFGGHSNNIQSNKRT